MDQDSMLINRIRQGDTVAFSALVDRHKVRVHSIAYHICGDTDESRDIAQQAFIRLYHQLNRYDPSRPLNAWLGRITVNLAIDARRKRLAARAVPLDDTSEQHLVERRIPSPDRLTEARELRGEIERICGNLTDRQRIAFVLIDLHEHTTAETASIMDCAESTVRVHLAAARRHIREALKKRYPGHFDEYDTNQTER